MLKYPQPGAVKTRLIPALGEKRSCDLYRNLVCHTLGEARRFASKYAVSLTACVADAPDGQAVHQWLGQGIYFQSQGNGDLGQRMEHAVQGAFTEGVPSVVVIGTDCPELTAEHLHSAFGALERKDVVLGPAADGGYYLIGMRRFMPELFRGIQWSSERVLKQTLAAARAAQLECELLDPLHDLDHPVDLFLWAQTHSARASGKGRCSIIIPALNEAQNLPGTVEAARQGDPHEIMIVDGGSSDETKDIARAMDAIVLTAPRCRAVQMNQGAAAATGEYLMFLHADTLLPSDYAAHIPALLAKPDVAGGAFIFAIAADFAGRRLVEYTTNWRARRRQLPYGDQALFLRRETFIQLGGFSETPIMEDYEFVRRLRRLGRIAIAPCAARTSGRRWQRLGVVRTTLINQAIILGYHLGISPSRLVTWYRGQCPQKETRLTTAGIEPRTAGRAVDSWTSGGLLK